MVSCVRCFEFHGHFHEDISENSLKQWFIEPFILRTDEREDAKLHAGKQSKIIDAIVQCKGNVVCCVKKAIFCHCKHNFIRKHNWKKKIFIDIGIVIELSRYFSFAKLTSITCYATRFGKSKYLETSP